MVFKRIRLGLLLPSIIFVFTLILLFMPIKECLVFQFQNSGHVLAYIPISKGEVFQMKYTHSIHLSHVVDSYLVTKNGQMKQYELMYEDFSIGMPAHAAEDETFERKDGKYYLKNMNRVFPAFDLRTGKVRANHTLIFQEKEFPLSHYLEPGTWVRIKVEKINLWQLWKGVNILDETL